MDLAAPKPPPTASPGEPDVIRRLPRGVEYTYVKMIILSLPSWLTTMTWAAREENDPVWKAFRGKTFRTLDRALQKREGACMALQESAATEERGRLIALRDQFVQQFLGEIGTPDQHGPKNKKWILIRNVDPSRFLPQFRPPEVTRPAVLIEVWRPPRREPTLVERRIVKSQPRSMGDREVNWIEPDHVNQTCSELFRKYFSNLMRRRVGHRWRSRREPVGWPLITRHAVPLLYDYLRPFYSVRKYQDGTAGHYPAQLRRDISDILRYELPHLAAELTIQRVTAAIQRHIRTADPRRPRGKDMFNPPIPQKKK